jgi:hypothetical protein
MSTPAPTVESLVRQARQLPPADRARLISEVAASLAEERSTAAGEAIAPIRGMLAGFGPAPSVEDIDEMRRDMLAGFPREDIP